MVPKQVKVGAVTFDIIRKDVIQDDSDIAGMYDEASSTISIRNDLSKQCADSTYIHELVHAMFVESGYPIDEGPHTEEVVERFSRVLHQVIVDNGRII